MVLENLVAAATFGEPKAHRTQSLETVFELFPRLRERSKQIVGTLSGGEQQMVAIGRALMTRPRLLTDFAYVLRQGQIVFSGESSALLDHPEVRRAYLGE